MQFYEVKRSKINIFGEHYVVLSSLKTPWYDEHVEKPSRNWNWTLMMECRSYTTARPLINAVTMFLDVRDCLVKWLKQLQRKNQHSSLLRSEAIGAPKGYVEGPVWWIPEISKQPERAETLSTAGKKWGASGTARVSLPGCSLDCVGSVKLEVNNSCGKPDAITHPINQPSLGGNYHPRYPTTNINHTNAADLAQYGTCGAVHFEPSTRAVTMSLCSHYA